MYEKQVEMTDVQSLLDITMVVKSKIRIFSKTEWHEHNFQKQIKLLEIQVQTKLQRHINNRLLFPTAWVDYGDPLLI